jgi:hypothetical protein
MNTKQTRQIRTAVLASAIVAVMTMVASPASAQHAHTSDSPAGMSGAGALAYGTPLASLDGRTLAQYVQEHQAQDRRTVTVI